MSEFNYMEFWALEEPAQKPHIKRADELGLYVYDIPASPVLPKLNECIRRIEEMYNVLELEEEGIGIEELLDKYTEMQVIEYLEEMGFERAITLGEIESLLFMNEWLDILQIPKIKSDFFLLRQFEECSNGKMTDVSAFSSVDFLRNLPEFDKYKYFTDKVAERVEDLAIMHSCISDEDGRQKVKEKFVALINNKYRNYALRLVAMIKSTNDEGRKEELMDKMREQNKQIRRLNAIWNKYAYKW